MVILIQPMMQRQKQRSCNMTKDEALKMAIEELAKCKEAYLAGPNWQKVGYDILDKSQQACKDALEQPAQKPVACHCGNPTFNLQSITHTKLKCFEQTTQEPVAWTDEHNLFLEFDKEWLCNKAVCKDHEAIPLYTHTAPSWQGLSDDEIAKIIGKGAFYEWNDVEFARAIEQALRNKNVKV